MEFVTIKWRERMAGKEPPPSHSSMEEIDVAPLRSLFPEAVE
jgi:hypothetical protein